MSQPFQSMSTHVTMNSTDDAYDLTCLSNVSLAVVEGFDHLISADPCSSCFVTLQQPDRSSSDSFSSVMNPLLFISNEPVSTFSDRPNLSVDQSDVVETYAARLQIQSCSRLDQRRQRLNKPEQSRKRGRPSMDESPSIPLKRKACSPSPTDDIRCDQIGHFPMCMKKRQRCRSCSKLARVMCRKRGETLCFTSGKDCFFSYHQ